MNVTAELDIPIVAIVGGTLAALYFGYEIEKQRQQAARGLQRLRQAGERDRRSPGAAGGERPAQVLRPVPGSLTTAPGLRGPCRSTLVSSGFGSRVVAARLSSD